METRISTWKVAVTVGCAAIILSAGIAQASIMPVTYGFNVINATASSTWHTSPDMDLSVEVSLVGSEVKFKFSNDSLFACSMTQIYFDDDSGSLAGIVSIDWGTQTGVNFVQGTNNGKLPGGENLTPRLEASNPQMSFSASPIAPVAPNGINPGEWLSLIFDLNSGKTSEDVIAAFDSDELRIGVHLQAFPDGSSASYVTPEPTTIALLGIGTITLLRRRKL